VKLKLVNAVQKNIANMALRTYVVGVNSNINVSDAVEYLGDFNG